VGYDIRNVTRPWPRGTLNRTNPIVTYRGVETLRGQHIELERLTGIDELWAAIQEGVEQAQRRLKDGKTG
jgi:hypothetical protein